MSICADCIIEASGSCSGCSGTPIVDNAVAIYNGVSVCGYHLRKRAGIAEHKHDR